MIAAEKASRFQPRIRQEFTTANPILSIAAPGEWEPKESGILPGIPGVPFQRQAGGNEGKRENASRRESVIAHSRAWLAITNFKCIIAGRTGYVKGKFGEKVNFLKQKEKTGCAREKRGLY